MEKIDLNLLLYLDVLLEETNISEAAKRLGITQPALSNALSRLRANFDDALLVRVGKKMVPTMLARQIKKPLRETLVRLKQDVVFSKKKFNPLESHFVFMTAFHGYEEALLGPEILKELSKFKNMRWYNQNPKKMHITKELCNGTIHFTATPETVARDGIMQTKIISDVFVCVAHKRADLSAFGLESYCAQNHLLITPHGGAGMIDDALGKVGKRRYVQTTVGEFSSAPLLLCADENLVSTVPKNLAEVWIKHFPLQIINCPVLIPPLSIFLSWHVSAQSILEIQWFKALLSQTICPRFIA